MPLRVRTVRAIAAFSLALAGARATAAQSARPDNAAARVDSIFAAYDKPTSPGCIVAASRNGVLLYERGYGMANLEHGIAIAPGSIFHVASISKQFTAASVMLLAERGQLSLDDDVRKYVAELPDYGHVITIRHLLTHTSGLRDQWSLLALAGWREDDVITEDDVLKIVVRQTALNFTPGTEYVYSNTGFTLAAVIVKRVSGQSLRAFADSNIFKPLGMTHTHFHDDHTMIVPNRTSAYQPRAGGWRVSIPVFDTYGATSLFTTADDLLLWEQNFTDLRVGSRAMFDAMQAPTILTGGDTSTYGLGLVGDRFRGVRSIGHAGADAGYRADVVRFPDQGVAVAVFCNLSNINPGALSRRVAAIYLTGLAPLPVAPPAAAVALVAEQLAANAGLYRNPVNDATQRLTVRNGKLVLGALVSTVLTPIDANRFLIPGGTTVVEVIPPVSGRPQLLRMVADGQKPVVFEQVPAFVPTAAELRAFAGNYTSAELDITYTIVPRDSGIVIQTRKGADITLQPTFRDAFVGGSAGIVKFTRDARGAVTGFTVNTGRVRSLRFDRAKS